MNKKFTKTQLKDNNEGNYNNVQICIIIIIDWIWLMDTLKKFVNKPF